MLITIRNILKKIYYIRYYLNFYLLDKKDTSVEIFTLCYNEEIILPYFFEHYKKCFSNVKFTIYDNYSTDKSKEIAQKEGANIIMYDSQNQIRDDLYLSIKNNCWKNSKAAWVIVCDTDELLQISDNDLLNMDKCSIISVEGYDMIGNTLNIKEIKRGVREELFSKNVMFRPNCLHITYFGGAHLAAPRGCVVYSDKKYKLFHYKWIKLDYVIERYKHFQSRLSAYNQERKMGNHYNASVESIQQSYEEKLKQSTQIIP
jgi:hypothetical protein